MLDFFKKVQNSYIYQKISYWMTEKPKSSLSVNLPFFATVFGSFNVLTEHFRTFLYLVIPFAVIQTTLALLFGTGQSCFYDWDVLYCNKSLWVYGIYLLVKYIVVSMFMLLYYQAILQPQQPIKFWTFDKRLWKIFAFNILSTLLCLVPAFSFYLMYERVPNPDWREEIVWFAFVALGFLVPFVLMRFYAYFDFLASEQPLPSLIEMWQRTSGNMLKIIFAFVFIALFFIFASAALLNNFNNGEQNIFNAVVLEFSFNFVSFTTYALLCAEALSLKIYLFNGEENDKN